MSATAVAPPVATPASEDTLPQAHTLPSAQRQQLLRSLQPRWDYGSQPDIIRSNQKDLHYQNVTHDTIKSAIQQHLGIRFVVRNQKAIQLVSKLIYYTTTTIQGAQTLGEEYCSIMQVDRHSMTYPTLLRRTVLVLFNTFGADLLTRAVRRMHVHFRELAQGACEGPFGLLAKLTAKEWWDVLAENFTAVHLMIFYFVGSYYDVSKRLTGIRYISTRKIGPFEIRGGYEILGVLLAIQLVVKLGYTVQDMLTCRSKSVVSSSPLSPAATTLPVDLSGASGASITTTANVTSEIAAFTSAETCNLCLSNRKETAATPCGHLFCWFCIFEWCNSKSECPLCRQEIDVTKIVRVYNC